MCQTRMPRNIAMSTAMLPCILKSSKCIKCCVSVMQSKPRHHKPEFCEKSGCKKLNKYFSFQFSKI